MSREGAGVIRFRNPIVSLENQPKVIIDQSAKNCDVRRSVSDTYSESQISFRDLTSGGTANVVDKKMFIEYSYNVGLSAGSTTAGQLLTAAAPASAAITSVGPTTISFPRGANQAGDEIGRAHV